MSLKSKLIYALFFAITFAILTAVSFLAGLYIDTTLAPPPVAQALGDLLNFVPIMTIGALIFGFAQTFLSEWLYQYHHKWFWPLTLILALLIGGLTSFFSLWLVWTLVTVANLVLNFVMTRFIELRQMKHANR